ncbi:MAG: hypothetical protein Q4A29_08070 [Eubacteriales bacterium]|nr:hypothetical protein [Eubacteriales bacterium]
MKKRKKGAMTLEAAIALPIYIFSILTLSYMIQAYYIENTIDAATATILQDVATKVFYLDQLGVIEAGDMIAERTKSKGDSIKANIEKGSGETDSDKGTDSPFEFSIGGAGEKLIDAWINGGVITIFKALLPFKGELTGQFEKSIKKMSSGNKTIADVFGKGRDAKGLGLTIMSETFSIGLEYVLSHYILTELRREMGENAHHFRIRSFEVDMGDQGILYTDKASGLNRLLTVNVRYKIGIPLFIAPEIELERTTRKTIRAWVGE